MQKFWYNSPVKFFRFDSELNNVLDPQNVQDFGEIKPYTLEKGSIHRFLVPENNNDTAFTSGFELYVVSGFTKIKITSDVYILDGKIKYITFLCNYNLRGFMQLQRGNDVIYISNCVRFLDTTQSDKKQARIITRHNYNRQLFDFSPDNAWFVTNIPSYENGYYSMDAEISNERIGGVSTLQTAETYLDEVVNYEISADGNGDIITFIQSSLTNIEFYLNGTKRTATEKLDVDDMTMFAQMSLVNVKDKNGFNIKIDEDIVFSDLNLKDISLTPKDNSLTTKANFNTNNRISIELNNKFNINPLKKASIYKNGVLLGSKLGSQLTKSGNVLIINDTTLNHSDFILDTANYYILLEDGLIYSDFNKKFTITDPTFWNFGVTDNTQQLTFINWIEGGTQDKSGNDTQVSVNRSDADITSQWQYYDGSNFVNAINGNDVINYSFPLQNGLNQFRNIAVDNNTGVNYISNVLKYNKLVSPTLLSVSKIANDTARIIWNNNGIDYGVNGSTILQCSLDNGLNWVNIKTFNSGSSNANNTLDVTSTSLLGLPQNTTIKFRISNTGNTLVNIISNVIDLLWDVTSRIFIPPLSIIKDTLGHCSYELHVEGAPFQGYVITQTNIIQNVKRISASFSSIGNDIPPNFDPVKTSVAIVNIPIGVYLININVSVIGITTTKDVFGRATVGYSFTPNLDDSICLQYAENIIPS